VLKTAPQEEADKLLRQIRSADDDLGRVEAKPPGVDDVEPAELSPPSGGRPQSDAGGRASSSSTALIPNLAMNATTTAKAPEGANPPPEDSIPNKVYLPTPDVSSDSLSAPHSFGLVRFLLPDVSLIQQAVDLFFSCSGKLFHISSQEQVAVYLNDSVDPTTPDEKIKAGLACLMGVAAVGAQYGSGVMSREVEHNFYDIARHYLESVIEHRPLDSIKVCTLLAQYNILRKATISLAYVGTFKSLIPRVLPRRPTLLTRSPEIGLGIARRHGLGTGAPRPAAMSHDQWIDYKKTWRTLTFFSRYVFSHPRVSG